MQRHTATVTDTQGNALSSASVQINTAGGSAATIYSDNGITLKTNPILTDGYGVYWFYAANGNYDIVVTKSGYTFDAADTAHVQLYDPAGSPGSGITLISPNGTVYAVTVSNAGLVDVNPA